MNDVMPLWHTVETIIFDVKKCIEPTFKTSNLNMDWMNKEWDQLPMSMGNISMTVNDIYMCLALRWNVMYKRSDAMSHVPIWHKILIAQMNVVVELGNIDMAFSSH